MFGLNNNLPDLVMAYPFREQSQSYPKPQERGRFCVCSRGSEDEEGESALSGCYASAAKTFTVQCGDAVRVCLDIAVRGDRRSVVGLKVVAERCAGQEMPYGQHAAAGGEALDAIAE